ncbi:hypothetical protein PN462_05930 [Spirulina sp. CS-785/01]|uniref:hypothetical protein n=1 Tax=Spirulina sp. CS-785/01 TaxID=3021716 RepID=UPI002331065A|nr:hypothetical protein [Spirulina sp. CS-785/01]MDB9312635.1 hypothetical protein [Spirulina sp. CS-785/01]
MLKSSALLTSIVLSTTGVLGHVPQPVSQLSPETPIAQTQSNSNSYSPLAQRINIPPPEEVSYELYSNSRYHFSVLYPNNILVPLPPPTNNDGREFISPNESIEMVAFGAHNSLDQTLEGMYNEALNAENLDVTYQRLEENWFIVSGYQGDTVVYTKVIFDERENVTDILTLDIRYDKALQPEFDRVVAEISNSFTSYQ